MTYSSSSSWPLFELKPIEMSFVDQALSIDVFISAIGHLQQKIGSRLTKRTASASNLALTGCFFRQLSATQTINQKSYRKKKRISFSVSATMTTPAVQATSARKWFANCSIFFILLETKNAAATKNGAVHSWLCKGRIQTANFIRHIPGDIIAI